MWARGQGWSRTNVSWILLLRYPDAETGILRFRMRTRTIERFLLPNRKSLLHLLPFHMPLCSGVWCHATVPALPSSMGEVSSDSPKALQAFCSVQTAHYLLHEIEVAKFNLSFLHLYAAFSVSTRFCVFENDEPVILTLRFSFTDALSARPIIYRGRLLTPLSCPYSTFVYTESLASSPTADF